MARIVEATDAAVREAAAIIAAGGLVAFPTETVYGLGANALDPDAVAKIFRAKARPGSNPIIVHVADPGEIATLGVPSDRALDLASRFWPGPLTLVLPKRPIVPDITTAGAPTVGLRMPANSIALDLIRQAEVPIAAPSANRSEEVSPTLAIHVQQSLGEAVDLILDGGPTEVGLESTVLDLSEPAPRVLRPGMVSITSLEAALGYRILRSADPDTPARSPGMRPRHYAPQATLKVVSHSQMGLHADAGLVFFGSAPTRLPRNAIEMPTEPAAYAARLYAALHELDGAGVPLILVEEVPEGDDWLAIRDRLLRATGLPSQAAKAATGQTAEPAEAE